MIPAALGFLPRRRRRPPEPDLDGPPSADRFAFIDSLPDPYGPDKTVFGPYRRALVTDADYGVGP